jgi:hypothetical protein
MFGINQYNNLKEFILSNGTTLPNNNFDSLLSNMQNLIYCEILH